LAVAAAAWVAGACGGDGGGSGSASAGGPVRFGIWGDTPYSGRELQATIPLIEQMNDSDLDLTIFVGDLFGSVCEDDLYASSVERFNSLNAPAVYVPGDNEWTDCNETAGTKKDPLERLAFIRRTMLQGTTSFGRKTISLERQRQDYPENSRWRMGQVLFVTLNVPGSNNNHVADPDVEEIDERGRGPAERRAAEAEYRARDEVNRAWLHDSFQAAVRDGVLAVVVAIHADPGFGVAAAERAERHVDGFDPFLAALVAEAKAYARPVLVVHGDSHEFVHDQPLIDPATAQPVPNVTRVETFGSPDVGWVQITIDPASPATPKVEPRLVRPR
jgi:hypothetical protein